MISESKQAALDTTAYERNVANFQAGDDTRG